MWIFPSFLLGLNPFFILPGFFSSFVVGNSSPTTKTVGGTSGLGSVAEASNWSDGEAHVSSSAISFSSIEVKSTGSVLCEVQLCSAKFRSPLLQKRQKD